ncbi:aspartate aminotransferase family protein [bacterium (Candidatus Blackallbacteria) CG17_big_fil_post_rev_8_21_14_2_50_48_46]|uniref:alanine--glyoxylate transaminase n=1 Tax=bacterium (Candidatus Blackallbacteria) CG17_big_fil_post_rev_8_21_14_2_50_48_46 TaxID=2014261 RepID=A0A2M7G5L7_9BACT|nr:MAG: aspartate aminotransferase family protein [bacterium (Candidatus Blackallbacteria) CG18_big_fil_WC_8_21_14_2_50_49_26]PIW17203.1 MAG: aspartate aminotransferase family protein [bacterium (Candidatus Blackallbacteria) CG17_big_fil_post_rev_8_21_14_2_50_48_46]PIW50994.1 MAG: aspartate aminotransferase family protein [bacterium (Candidatus Blackallbacteria) CG13_big_fil_rev_8_21_14_2_50_49_14]
MSELLARRKKVAAHSNLNYYQEPLHAVKAKDTRIWDAEGREYLDAIGGIVSISVGHNHPKVKAALKEMFDQDFIQHPSVLYLSEPHVRLCENLANAAPEGLDRVMVTNSGSEANEYASMAARAATGEEMIIALKLGYHGGTQLTLNLCGHSTWKFRGQPFAGVAHATQPDCYRCPFGQTKGSCGLECAKDVENTIQTVTHGKIAGVIVEPIQGVGGFVEPPVEYHAEVYRICKKYGGMYISDEVQTGIGRTGESFFAISQSGITPDMITLAKSLGNGAPVGAVVMSEECSQALIGKTHFNTFGGDPYQALQAALTIEIMQEENLIENIRQQGAYLKDGLMNLKEKYSLIGDVRGRGLMLGLELVKDRQSKEHATAETAQMMEETRKRGLLIGKGGLFGNVIRMAPPYTITRSDCDEILRILDESFAALKA